MAIKKAKFNKVPLLRLTIRLGIIIFWLVMIGLLVKREMRAEFSLSSLPASTTITQHTLFREDWMGIYYNSRKIGYSSTIFQDLSQTKKDLSGYTIYHTTFLNIPILNEVRSIEINGNAFLDGKARPQAFQFNLKSGAYIMNLKGELKGEKFIIKISYSPQGQSQELVMDKDFTLFSTVNPSLFLQAPKPGKTWTLKIFDPISLNSGLATIRILGKEKYKYPLDNQPQDAYLLEVTYQGISVKSWVSADGQILRQESPLGLVIVKEPKEEATKLTSYDRLEKDILSSISIPSNLSIEEPQNLKSLKLELKEVDLTGFDFITCRQKLIFSRPNHAVAIINKEDTSGFTPLTLPIKKDQLNDFLKPELLIQSDDPKITQKAKEIVGQEKDSLKASLRLLNWVFREIKKSPSLGLPSATSVLENKEGDCNEHTYLYVALARAMGIPSKIVTGLVYYKGRFYYHTWPKVFVGRWIELDPTLGQETVGAMHIQFLEGGLERQVEIIKLIRKLKLKVIEYR